MAGRRRIVEGLALALLAWAPAAAQTPPAPAPTQAAPSATPAPAPSRPPRYGYEVVNTFPHDPTAFTQGLVFHDGVLLESTGRHPSSVRRVRLEDGEVLLKRDLDTQFFGEGLTVVRDRIVTLTWQGGHGFLWDIDDLEPAGTFSYRGEGWGLTTDGSRVILSDGTPVLRFLDPITLAETGSITVNWQGRPLPRLNELEWVDGEILANVWKTDVIVRIDPADGAIKGVIDLTGLLPAGTVADPTDDVLNGIAWDAAGRRLFVTGKNWPSLFEIRITAPAAS